MKKYFLGGLLIVVLMFLSASITPVAEAAGTPAPGTQTFTSNIVQGTEVSAAPGSWCYTRTLLARDYSVCSPDQDSCASNLANASYNSGYSISGSSCVQTPGAVPTTNTQPQDSPAPTTPAAQGFSPLVTVPGLIDTTSGVVNSGTLANFINNLYKYCIGLAAILAIIEIIWGGLEISTKDSVSQQSDGRERIRLALYGLILVLAPALVFSVINPNILNLSLSLPELNTKSVLTGTSTFGAGNSSAATAASCSVALGSGTVGCPSAEAAQAFATSCSNGPGKIFTTNDPKLPYSASCNTLQPFQGHRDYTDVSQIPNGYWCYKVKVIANSTVVYTYVCQVDSNSCSHLAVDVRPVVGEIVSDCKSYP